MSTDRGRSGRLSSLDGLRGLAALVVLFHHSLLTAPTFSAAETGTAEPRLWSGSWWLTYTPLHLVWAGGEAVIVFFVLSGFVLTRAAAAKNFTWRSYYPSRLLRLYLPVWAAVALGIAWFEAVPRKVTPGGSWWLNVHHERLMMTGISHDLILVKGTSWLVSPLWSLEWEVWFSLLLPLAVLGAGRRKWWAALQLVALIAAMDIGSQTNHASAVYLPMFGIGVLMARQYDVLSAWAGRLTRVSWVPLAAAAPVLLTASWTFHDFPSVPFTPVETIGAALTVFLFAFWQPVRAAAESRRVQWLGKRSFSLYLVHEPIVVSIALLLGSPRSPWLTLLIAVPACLAFAQLFYVAVERPSHRAARALKRHGGRSREPVAVAIAPEPA